MTRITAGSAGILPAGLWFRFRIRRQDAGAPGDYGHSCTWKNSAGADPAVSALVAVYVKTPLA